MQVHCAYDVLVPISELKLNPKNRNAHSEPQIRRLAQILLFQGFRYPVKVSRRSGLVVSGHGRIAAALLNDWAEVPVNFQDYDSDEMEYADGISDNSIASWGELDLSGINTDLGTFGDDFDIDLLGLKDLVSAESINRATNTLDTEWVDMPEFKQEDKTAYRTIHIHFANDEGVRQFAAKIEKPITQKTKYLWYPDIVIEKMMDKRYRSEE